MAHSRTISQQHDLERLARYLGGLTMPFTVTVALDVKRSNAQNRLQRKWCQEVAEQRGDVTSEDVRGESKARFGIPILCRDDEAFAAEYDKMIRPLPFETKMALMKEPFDFGVTRLMKKKQKMEYLDRMYAFWSAEGFVLTDPERMS